MDINRLMFKSYLVRINSENIKEELCRFGVNSYDEQGKRRDSLELLNQIIKMLDKLLENKEYIAFNYVVRLLVGEYYSNKFIDMFFYEKIK